MSIYGIVLAGGLSRRMGGVDKALVDLGGQSLLAHVLGRLGPQCLGVVLSSNGDPSAFKAYGVPVVADDIQGFAGPVAGLVAAMDWIADHHPQVDTAVTCAVDTPFVPRNLATRLRQAALDGETRAACAMSDDRRHPVAALWPVAARHELRRALETEHQNRLSAALHSIGCTQTAWSVDNLDPFLNINTPADLDRARQLMERGFPS